MKKENGFLTNQGSLDSPRCSSSRRPWTSGWSLCCFRTCTGSDDHLRRTCGRSGTDFSQVFRFPLLKNAYFSSVEPFKCIILYQAQSINFLKWQNQLEWLEESVPLLEAIYFPVTRLLRDRIVWRKGTWVEKVQHLSAPIWPRVSPTCVRVTILLGGW